MRRSLILCLLCIAGVTTFAGAAPPLVPSSTAPDTAPAAATAAPALTTVALADLGVTLKHSAAWTAAPSTFSNAHKLVSADSGDPARIMITSEVRRSHDEAVLRLQQIAMEQSTAPTYLVIAGWPALQRRYIAPRPHPGDEEGASHGELLLKITTAVAIDNVLVRLEASIPKDRATELGDSAEAVGRSLVAATVGDPAAVQRELNRIRSTPLSPSSVMPGGGAGARQLPARVAPKTAAAPGAVPPAPAPQSAGAPANLVASDPGPGAPLRVVGGASELEVTTSTDGKTVIVATNGGYSYSNDGGKTFTYGGRPSFPAGYFNRDGDPSLGVGKSGTIYYALIGYPTSTTNGTAISASTNSGQTFAFRSNAVVCPNASTPPAPPVPNACFADQEHITADRFNAAPGGDQVYSTWRNFDATDQDPAIVCSQDSGQTWTAPVTVGSGFVPRIGIGQDGFVYVIYRSGGNIMLAKYSSCANGLAMQGGFPALVTSVSDVACPLAGLDRCNDGNILSSHTVAVDDTNANHVYVAYSTNTGGANENVIVRDSTDGGQTFPRSVTINGGGTGHRFMPWVCSVNGAAHVSWYDRRFAGAGSADVTDFYRGSASVSGGSLVAGTEVRLTANSDAQCFGGFPCGSRAQGDSETCPVQPQLAGYCKITPTPNPDTSSNTRCDFDETTCPTGETCQVGGGGCPKYGDYNGNACGVGRVYTAWASATAPPGQANTGNIDTYFQKDIVCCVPEISAPASIALPATCAGDTGSANLNVCNTGLADLVISGISSSDSQFLAPGPFPVTIGAGACKDIPIDFKPTSRGAKSATLTIASNDPVYGSTKVSASGTGKGIVSITCPADVNTVNDPGLCSALVNPGAPTVDAEGCPTTTSSVRSDGLLNTDPFPVGTTTITWKATDGGNNSLTCSQSIVVRDVEPPVISNAAPTPSVLWPPNHKMVRTTVDYTVKDNCDPPNLISCGLAVASNEPINGLGDGDTAPDWQILDNHHVLLRSERSGTGSGRIYTITITCSDSKGNASSTNVVVNVPHDQPRQAGFDPLMR